MIHYAYFKFLHKLLFEIKLEVYFHLFISEFSKDNFINILLY